MKLYINPFLILRIPAFFFEEQIGTVWEDLKAFIAYSSPDFFERIKEIGMKDYQDLMAKHNTPFGNTLTGRNIGERHLVVLQACNFRIKR